MTVFGNTSIRTKLALAFGFLVVLVMAVGSFGLIQLHSVNRVAWEFTDVSLPHFERLGEIKRLIGEHRTLAARRTQTTNFHHLASIARSMDEASRTLRSLRHDYRQGMELLSQTAPAATDAASEQKLLADFDSYWSDYEAALRTVFQRLDMGEISVAIQEFNTVSLFAFDKAAEQLDSLILLSKSKGDIAAARARDVYQLALYLTAAVILLAVGLAVIAVIWTSRNVSSPILRISNSMQRLAAGDHSVTIDDIGERKDEVGILATSVAGYRDSLLRSGRLAEETKREQDRLHNAISNMTIGLCMFDAEERLIVCNSQYAKIYGLSREVTKPGTHIGQILADRSGIARVGGDNIEEHAEHVMQIVRAKAPALNLVELKDGRIISVVHQPTEGGGWVATHEDVTDRRQAEARIRHMARHDALTDLPNRVLFRERVEEALERSGPGQSIALLCLDLDRFKDVNDTLGHSSGDAVLRSVAARLRDSLREGDTVARLGGDEFAVIQVGVDQPTGATALAQRIIEAISAPHEIDGHHLVIGTSIGITLAPTDGGDANRLLKNGDMALYRAKSDGRNTYRFFERGMDARIQMRRALELDLRKALLQGEFRLHYQPVIELSTGKVSGFEALLRWYHPERGMIAPADFIPLAEETGLIVPLGEWVLRQACLDATTWPEEIGIAVNLSPAQFKSKKLLEAVITALAVSKLRASRLELEITEGVLLIEHEETLVMLHKFRALGVRIAMDDFGTGYSSLSYLRSFPFNKIKIDRSFIRNISDDSSSLAIIRAVTGLSTSLGMATTAEGVETEAQLESVRAEGCTEVQGFLFSAAVPANNVKALLVSLSMRAKAAA